MSNEQADPESSDGGPPTPQAHTQELSHRVDRLYRLVPEIGAGWRWYDLPYRFLDWWMSSWRRKLLPWRFRRLIGRAMNLFFPFNQLERAKAARLDDPVTNLVIPSGERISQAGFWAVELFAPSHYTRLEAALQGGGWDVGHDLGLGGTPVEQVRRAREGRGFSWLSIGSVLRPGSNSLPFNAKYEELPDELDVVTLKAVQIGTSITAIVAYFGLSDDGQVALDQVWRARHEPRLKWQGLFAPFVLNRHHSAILATQQERLRIHNIGRRWLAERFDGFFSSTSAGQPVIDLHVFDNYDPTSRTRDRSMSDALRALGLAASSYHRYTSAQMPGAVLFPTPAHSSMWEPIQNCWGIVGNFEQLSTSSERLGYSERPRSVARLGVMLDEAARPFALYISVLRYFEELRAEHSALRDRALTRHGRVGARQLLQLRDEMLTIGLDLPSVARDTESLWSDSWRTGQGLSVRMATVDRDPAIDGYEADLITRLGEVRSEICRELLSDNDVYRHIMSTTAALGASADSMRAGRLALFVAGVSLLALRLEVGSGR